VAALAVIRHASGSGGSVSASVTVDLGTPAVADHSLVVAYVVGAPVSSGPAGFTLDLNVSPGAVPTYWWRLERTVGGEQTCTVTHVTTGIPGVWCIWETDLLDTISPFDEGASTATFHPATTATTLTTGTTAGATGTLDTLCLAVHAFYTSLATLWSGTFATWSGQTGGFVEDEEAVFNFTGVGSNQTYVDAAFSSMPAVGVAGPFSSTATFSTDATRSGGAGGTDSFTASVVSYSGPTTVEADLGMLVSGGGVQ
jgi:hypothetical protein